MANLRHAFDRRRPDFPAGTPFWNDGSFERLLARCPALRPMHACVRSEAAAAADAGIQSSYRDHGYGAFFYALVRCLQPRRCIELGVLHGFSLIAAARALRANGAGYIDGFDLFEDYPYAHAPHSAVVERIRAAGLQDWARVHRADADHVSRGTGGVDYLHVDLSNDGDRFRRTFERWQGVVAQAIVLEGGSEARDKVDWMIRYRRPPIAIAVTELQRDYPDWTIAVLEPYPSLTVAVRR